MQRSLCVAVVLMSAGAVMAQTLSPREIFYGEGRSAPSKASTVSAKPKPAIRKAAPNPTTSENSVGVPPTAPEPENNTTYRLIGDHVGPLGLKYSLLKRDAAGQYAEVDPDSSFTAGDHIRLTVEVNAKGYLYVINQGSSGIWKVLFPSAESGGDNRVQEGRSYRIPTDAVFSFDTRRGSEKLFIILARQPEKDLENLIYSLQDSKPKKGEISRPMLASNIPPIQDDLVQRMRQTYSRDLVIEKVDDSKSPPPEAIRKLEQKEGASIPPAGEKAMYVVNPTAGENARVVADVELKHE